MSRYLSTGERCRCLARVRIIAGVELGAGESWRSVWFACRTHARMALEEFRRIRGGWLALGELERFDAPLHPQNLSRTRERAERSAPPAPAEMSLSRGMSNGET